MVRGGRFKAESMRASGLIGILLLGMACSGCGTTKWTDTARTATEQLLITDSIDRAVSRLNLASLAGKTVFVDDAPIKQVTDNTYVVSAVRQHVLASGAILKDKREDADYVLEIRAGAIGTDHNDLLFGIPPTTLPTIGAAAAVPNQIPEIAFAKKTDQRAVAKISLFAYNKKTGRPVWQSGSVTEQSNTKALWVLGAGPFQRGTIHRGTTFAGSKVRIPLIDLPEDGNRTAVAVADEAFFVEPKESPAAAKPAGTDAKNAGQTAAQPDAKAKDQAAVPPAAKAPVASAAATPAAQASTAATPAATAPPASTPSATTPAPVQPAAATAPSNTGDKRAERIGDLPTSPPSTPPQPPAPGDFRAPSSQPSPSGVSPVSASLPLGTSSAVTQFPESLFFGDTWLDRRR